ncbi:helix-turn-helix transcriptional regulator [Clostridium sp. UBA3887]|uniref:helix-turn-helix domain-containing protein n=1 Tax=Clostridium sp. UBA3887 TaxID=1946356 RepID=UPI0032174CB1
MNRLDKIKDIEYKIRQIKMDIEELDRKYLKAYAPKGHGHGTSYNDYDTIPGGNKELHLESYHEERKKKETLLELNEEILLSLKMEVDINEYLSLLTNNYQKVKFLRIVKGYTQAKTAEIIGISERTVQRIENNL